MLKLLTDALRRGPGSPEWHEAIQQLRTSGAKGADEHRLLITVRERLEAGQEYRSVRAGPAFTSELFSKLEKDPEGAPRRPWIALVVATLCLIVVIGSAAMLTNYLSNKPARDPAIERLAQQLFVNPTFRVTFEKPVTTGLTTIGDLKLESNGGLRIANVAGPNDPRGTVVVRHADPLNLTGGTCVELDTVLNRAGDATAGIVLWPADLAEPRTGSGTFIFSMDSGGYTVIAGGSTTRVARSIQAGKYTLRLKVAGDVAIAEVSGQEIWSGRHEVGTATAQLGIRLQKTGKNGGDLRVMSLRELRP
jgi:hypothetical protein